MADPAARPSPDVGREVESPAEPDADDEVLIQVDSDLSDRSDADSSYGYDDDSESTQSLYSSITRHVYENGRRYHSYRQGSYW